MIKLLSVDLDIVMENKYYRGMVAGKLTVHLWSDLYSHLPLYWYEETDKGNMVVYMEDKDYFNALIDPLIVNQNYPEVTPTVILMNILTNWNEYVKNGWADKWWKRNKEILQISISKPPIVTFW